MKKKEHKSNILLNEKVVQEIGYYKSRQVKKWEGENIRERKRDNCIILISRDIWRYWMKFNDYFRINFLTYSTLYN